MTTDAVKVAPSILAADFARMGDQVAEAERAGADRVHVDPDFSRALILADRAAAEQLGTNEKLEAQK